MCCYGIHHFLVCPCLERSVGSHGVDLLDLLRQGLWKACHDLLGNGLSLVADILQGPLQNGLSCQHLHCEWIEQYPAFHDTPSITGSLIP